jgi:hypothetical protein
MRFLVSFDFILVTVYILLHFAWSVIGLRYLLSLSNDDCHCFVPLTKGDGAIAVWVSISIYLVFYWVY